MTSVASFVVAFATALAGLAAAVASFLVAEGSVALKKRKDCHCCLPPSQAAFLAHSAGGFSEHCDWLELLGFPISPLTWPASPLSPLFPSRGIHLSSLLC